MRQRAQNFPIIGSHAVFELLSDPAKYADVKEKLKFKKRKKINVKEIQISLLKNYTEKHTYADD